MRLLESARRDNARKRELYMFPEFSGFSPLPQTCRKRTGFHFQARQEA